MNTLAVSLLIVIGTSVSRDGRCLNINPSEFIQSHRIGHLKVMFLLFQ